MKRRGNRWPEIGKLRTARWVEAPYSASAGTSISPIESFSTRVRGVSVIGSMLLGSAVTPRGARPGRADYALHPICTNPRGQ